VETFTIEHCQKHVAIFRYCLEDEMPHERPLGDIRKFRIDLAQNSGAERLGRSRITLGYTRRCGSEAGRFDVSQLPDRFVAAGTDFLARPMQRGAVGSGRCV
jgi:hypothetical protein